MLMCEGEVPCAVISYLRTEFIIKERSLNKLKHASVPRVNRKPLWVDILALLTFEIQ